MSLFILILLCVSVPLLVSILFCQRYPVNSPIMVPLLVLILLQDPVCLLFFAVSYLHIIPFFLHLLTLFFL